MGDVRPLRDDDLPAVAALFQQVFRDAVKEPAPELATYLHRLYFEMPGRDPEIAPLVHIDTNGAITGFIGVNCLPMRFEGRRLRAAVCGSLMVADPANDPMAGARLLKACLAGPQDLSLSETASEVSARMWTGLRGIALPQYSLDWVRIIRPSAFLLDIAGQRFGGARLLMPLARGLDRFLGRRVRPGELRWSGVPREWIAKGGLSVSEIDRAGFADLVIPLTEQFAMRPDWGGGLLEAELLDAEEKPEYGDPAYVAVKDRRGQPVGAFFYHTRPGRIARVLQILARPGLAEPVIDCLIGDAAARGAAGLRGRIQPALLDAMLGRRIAFTHVASTVVHSRDPDLIRVCVASQAFLNGLSGEQWNRLIGGGLG